MATNFAKVYFLSCLACHLHYFIIYHLQLVNLVMGSITSTIFL